MAIFFDRVLYSLGRCFFAVITLPDSECGENGGLVCFDMFLIPGQSVAA